MTPRPTHRPPLQKKKDPQRAKSRSPKSWKTTSAAPADQAAVPTTESVPPPPPAKPAVPAASGGQAAQPVPAAPSVRRFAREIGLDISQVPGTGPAGRISTEDVKSHSRQLSAGRGTAAGVAPSAPLPDFTKWGPVENRADEQPAQGCRRTPGHRLDKYPTCHLRRQGRRPPTWKACASSSAPRPKPPVAN